MASNLAFATEMGAISPKGGSRKPTALKEREGTLKPSRENKAEPQGTAVSLLPPPEDLSAEENRLWIEIAKVIDPLRISTAGDMHSFRLLVNALAVIDSTRRSLWKDNPECEVFSWEETRMGDRVRKKRPELDVLLQYHKIALIHLTRFGMTPADRSRVSVLGDNTKKDALGEFVDDE